MTFIYTIKHIALYTGTLTICCVWKCHLKVATIWFCLFLCLIIDTDNVFSLFIFNFFFFLLVLKEITSHFSWHGYHYESTMVLGILVFIGKYFIYVSNI